jgi:hypothetical protein
VKTIGVQLLKIRKQDIKSRIISLRIITEVIMPILIISTAVSIIAVIAAVIFALAMRAKLGAYSSPFINIYPVGHSSSPVPDLEWIRKWDKRIFKDNVVSLDGIDLNEKAQLGLLNDLSLYYADLPFSAEKNNRHRYYFENRYFTYSDAIVLYSIMRHFKPERIIEIGSGFSSAVMLDTNEIFPENRARLTFIEPDPGRLLSLIHENDKKNSSIITDYMQNVDMSVFKSIKKNDILFIDSSHVVKVGSDVNYILFEVLPALVSGVLVHFHDIFWPFEYPREWFEAGRGWNEIYAIRAFLMYNKAFEILFFNPHIGSVHKETLSGLMPLCMKDIGASLWLKKV